MCLDRLAEKNVANPGRIRQGWKVFVLGGNRSWYFECFKLPGHITARVPQGRWLKSSKGDELSAVSYPNGFHIFTRKRDARLWGMDLNAEIVKVQYKNVVACGGQSTFDKDYKSVKLSVHVAQDMFVPKGE